MGLTNNSMGIKAADSDLNIKKINESDKIIALAGNPNVGKSTVFNNLTGMHQHTGNWPGKTVTNAYGYCNYKDSSFVLVDIPGTYSLMAHSVEEEVARNFICFGSPDAIIVVCDATCLERNFNLVLQTLEITDNVVVCVNLLDEAEKKHIRIDIEKISKILSVPVVGTVAANKKTLDKLMFSVDELLKKNRSDTVYQIEYPQTIEKALEVLTPVVIDKVKKKINPRWLSLRLLDYDEGLINSLNEYLGFNIIMDEDIKNSVQAAKKILTADGINSVDLRDRIVSAVVLNAERICRDTVHFDKNNYNERDRKIDRILTDKRSGFPIMILMLIAVFWLTITGANIPSAMISKFLFWVQDRLSEGFAFIGAPEWLHGMFVLGVYRVVAWVVSVMLPPMAIFFPLFTLLEDLGYLPRVAFNLDKYFKGCCACGKQALTMCMGFGCNAAGIIGCRIIDSPRERLIAMITNNFVPCNGRFPTLISILTMFFIGSAAGCFNSFLSALLLTGVIIFGVFMTFLISKILSKTILKGVPSSFTLELPPYRKPQIGKIIVRSIFDRTLFVLGRAISVAAPAGLVIWIMANVSIGDMTILKHCSTFLDPFGKFLGMDGIILLAFVLGFPANEIVVPIIIMAYMASGTILEFDSIWDLKQLLVDNGWTQITAISTMLFSLMHWPCSTTCLTIKKETLSWKWTAISIAVPTLMGIIVCLVFANIAKLLF